MEVYADDMLIKSEVTRTHIDNLREAFATLQKYQIKLNPTKCTFRVTSDKFLSFMIFSRGVQLNLEKIKTIYDMTLLRIIK